MDHRRQMANTVRMSASTPPRRAAMAFSREDIRANREYFANKLRAEKQKNDVIKRVKGEPGAGEFLLLDVRPRDAFAKAHIRGAFSAPLEELGALTAQLPQDRELVTYCWNDT
jgi:Rhodanese-like domain